MDVQKQTEIVLAWELYQQGMSKSAIARRLNRHRDTIIEWCKAIEQVGLLAFVESSQQACKVARPSRQGASFAPGGCPDQDVDMANPRTRA